MKWFRKRQKKVEKVDVNELIKKCDELVKGVEKGKELKGEIAQQFSKGELQFLTYQYIMNLKNLQDKLDELNEAIECKELDENDVMFG